MAGGKGMSTQAHLLPDGRLHLNHGPMDLILQAWGAPDAVHVCLRPRHATVSLVCWMSLSDELPALRSADGLPLNGRVARAMGQAVAPFRPAFITPMAAVAGAVADEILAHLVAESVTRAYVNNGGDIALYLTPGHSLTAAIVARPGLPDRVTIRHEDPVRGIATSGWRGRSFSLGIADAVTILATTAATADAAATIIANAVTLPGHPAITRRPATDIKADSDLGAIMVTTDVGPLTPAEVARALASGLATAREAQAGALIDSAALFLHGDCALLDPRTRTSHFLSPNIPGVRGQRPRRVAAAGGETSFSKEPAHV